MHEFTSDELQHVLHEHAQWIKSEGKSGKRANLSWSDLCGANLSVADLTGADLRGAVLRGSVLSEADLRGSDLRGADLRESVLSGIVLSGAEGAFVTITCPSDGAFIGWKKCRGDLIVKLLIPEDARRLSGTGRQCRCDKAKVLDIQTMDGKPTGTTAYSTYCSDFAYTIGATVVPDVFCADRWQECGGGIHFFITREEAVQY